MKGEFSVVTFAVQEKRHFYRAVSNVFINPTYMDSLNLSSFVFSSFKSLHTAVYLTSWLNIAMAHLMPFPIEALQMRLFCSI